MIWKDYPKLSEIASYSNLVRESKAPPPGGIGLKFIVCINENPPNGRPLFSKLQLKQILNAQGLFR